ncbi:MAG: hypothetical protein WD035_03055 [Balneolaceae bacterium]
MMKKSEKEIKIDRLVEHAFRAYEGSRELYIKMPIEMAQYALTQHKIREVQSYLAGHFIYPGKAPICNKPVIKISKLCKTSVSTVYRALKWLRERNWIGKDDRNGWYFFRALNRIHDIEKWMFSRAVITKKKMCLT